MICKAIAPQKISSGLLFFAIFALPETAAYAQCKSDLDCRNQRICEAGKCTDPAVAPGRKTCSKDIDCPGEEICQERVCTLRNSAPQEPPGVGPGGPRVPTSTASPPRTPSTVAPTELYDDEPEPRLVVKRRTRKWLWIPGLVALVGGWVGSWMGPLLLTQNLGGFLVGWIPLIGSWIGFGLNSSDADDKVMFATAGTFQVAGLLALILGLTLKEKVKVETYSLSVMPGPVGSGLGVNVGLVNF